MMGRLLLMALALGGCISTSPATWSHTPDDTTAVKRAIYECRHDADAESYRATQFGGVIMPIVGLFSRQQTFKDCMISRGYKAI